MQVFIGVVGNILRLFTPLTMKHSSMENSSSPLSFILYLKKQPRKPSVKCYRGLSSSYCFHKEV